MKKKEIERVIKNILGQNLTRCVDIGSSPGQTTDPESIPADPNFARRDAAMVVGNCRSQPRATVL